MNILLRHKLKQIRIHRTTNYLVGFKNMISLFALTGFALYSYRRRIKAFIHRKTTVNISNGLSTYFHSVLLSDEIKKNSIDLMNNLFTNSSTKRAFCELIKGTLEDKEIMNKVKAHSTSFLMDLIKDKSIKEQFIRNIIQLMQNKELKRESIDLLKGFFDLPKTKEIFIDFFREVVMKEEIKQMFTGLITDSVNNTLSMADTKKKGAEFLADIWSDPMVRWNFLKKSITFWQSPNQASLNNNAKH